MKNDLLEIADLYIGADNVKTIIEAGACDCTDSIKLQYDYPNATVYAFECNPETIPLCKKNIEPYPRIVLTEKALLETEGFKTFLPIDTDKTVTTHENGNPGASSFFPASTEYPVEKYVQKTAVVEATTLQEFCKNIPGIDIMWLDAQGSELNILKGLGERIHDVKIIKTEVLFKQQYIGAPLFDEIVDFLESKDFRFIRFTDKYVWFGDAIFISNKVQ